MSRQLRANRFTAKALRSCTRTSRFVEDYDDFDGAGPSGVNPPPRPQPAPAAYGTDIGDSDWEMEFDDSDIDRTYQPPPRAPVNFAGRHDLSDSDTEVEFEEEGEDVDYVRMHDSTLDSVPDSDLPLAFRIARQAQVNAPGTDAFSWRHKTDAMVRRGVFIGVYLLC